MPAKLIHINEAAQYILYTLANSFFEAAVVAPAPGKNMLRNDPLQDSTQAHQA